MQRLAGNGHAGLRFAHRRLCCGQILFRRRKPGQVDLGQRLASGDDVAGLHEQPDDPGLSGRAQNGDMARIETDGPGDVDRLRDRPALGPRHLELHGLLLLGGDFDTARRRCAGSVCRVRRGQAASHGSGKPPQGSRPSARLSCKRAAASSVRARSRA